jgi:hypothetical protein
MKPAHYEITWLSRTSETFTLLVVRKVQFSQVTLGAEYDKLVEENFILWGVKKCHDVSGSEPKLLIMQFPVLMPLRILMSKFYQKDCQQCQGHIWTDRLKAVWGPFPRFSTEFMRDCFLASRRYCMQRKAQLGRCFRPYLVYRL